MAELLPFPALPEHDPICSYRQLAAPGVLSPEGVSVRFLRARRREGMPSEGFDAAGRRVFRLSEVRVFLEARNAAMGRGGDAA